MNCVNIESGSLVHELVEEDEEEKKQKRSLKIKYPTLSSEIGNNKSNFHDDDYDGGVGIFISIYTQKK